MAIIDGLILLWIMPPLGFLITILQIPSLRYLTANYVIMAVLIYAIAVASLSKRHTPQTILYLTIGASLAALAVGIEWLHFTSGRTGIDGLTDVRMIIYSPLYGSIISFVLYFIYLGLLDRASRASHFAFFIRLMSCFHFAFVAYWMFLYLDWIEAIPRADLLHSNSVSYSALFTLCTVVLFGSGLGYSSRAIPFLALLNLPAILVNESRGAMIGLLVLALHLVNEYVGRMRRATTIRLALGSLFALVALAAVQSGLVADRIVGGDSREVNVLFDQVYNAYQEGSPDVSIETSVVSDESTISAFSRVGANYYSFLQFMDHPLVGIGQQASYALQVLGSGIHSFHFLIVAATGVVGALLLYSSIGIMFMANKNLTIDANMIFMIAMFYVYMLVFVNDLPIYLAILSGLAELRARRVVPPAPVNAHS